MILKSKTLLFISLLAFSMLSLMFIAAYVTKNVHADTEEIESNKWETRQLVSLGATRAERPTIAAAPNGKTVLVAYIGKLTKDGVGNPYYSFSTNNGKTGSWTYHRAIYPASAANSEQVKVAFDSTNKAHAVWIENGGLAYANSTNLNNGFNAPKIFIDNMVKTGVVNAQIITLGNFVHIVGAATDQNNNSNIFHVQSSNGGTSWGTPKLVTNNTLQTDRPTVDVDNNGNLYLVYRQQRIIDLAHFHLKYARGTFNGSTVDWNNETAHVDITGSLLTGNSSLFEPSILFTNGRLEVSATQKYDGNDSQAEQHVYYLYCNGSCTNAGNWSQQKVSGNVLYINNNPLNLVSDIVRLGSCTNIVFDGKVGTTLNPAEQIFSSSSCSGWGNARSSLTDPNVARSIQPAVATQNNWWMYIVYEEFADDVPKVYFMRNIPGVYLPIIRK